MARPSPARQRAMKQEAAANRRAARVEEEHRQAILASFSDTLLVRCLGCGLEQISAGTGHPFTQPCVLCGGDLAEFVESLAKPCIVGETLASSPLGVPIELAGAVGVPLELAAGAAVPLELAAGAAVPLELAAGAAVPLELAAGAAVPLET
jgi:hypothetical protein